MSKKHNKNVTHTAKEERQGKKVIFWLGVAAVILAGLMIAVSYYA